ncbi:hypothetical protein [Butyricicoccus pullicaecorum]|uniref:hypothetical protein n=1 Tax=Butyricicoccus pullicaecorum TaxID=501571 RepID=UPI001A9A6883|nr:hypothetical protein [Butyricicoccus pullicaecorum]
MQPSDKKEAQDLPAIEVVEKLRFFDDQTSAAQSALDEECPKPRINERIPAFCCVKSHARVATFYEISCAPQAQRTFPKKAEAQGLPALLGIYHGNIPYYTPTL